MDDNASKPLPKYGTTLQDKVLILQARDKYVRSQRKKQTDIETAQIATGNCADMCPELERYFRKDAKLVVSAFEETGGEPDEHKMVKEYVRSSADQEEPLPYELRPPAVLERTMLYLAKNVMDLIDDPSANIEEPGWYDFLWNRTRAIRKDITQQDLKGLSSVHLMERCARFHIYSGHRFFGQDPQFFPRINDENLVKSIQSLKDFYYDLSLKGVACPNEAEFRGYDILLNLGNNDVLRGVSRLRQSVRNSEEIKFAIRVHAAFSNNNYVKFFKLLKEATFLNACVMHRYFGVMRFHAFRLLRKAFTHSNQQEGFAKEYMFDQLCFDDEEEFDEFCGKVEVGTDDYNIYLDKSNLYLLRNENLPAPFDLIGRRSNEYIDAKKGRRALSEIIYHEPMGANPYRRYPLQISFDENGQLVDAEIQLDAETSVKINHSTVQAFSAKTSKEQNNRPAAEEKPTAKPAFGLSKGLFSQPNVFKSSNADAASATTNQNLFGKRPALFTSSASSTQQSSANVFGPQQSLFSAKAPTTNQNLFGKDPSTNQNLFGKEASANQNLFGKESPSANLFAPAKEAQPAQSTTESSSIFGSPAALFSKAATAGPNLFSASASQPFSFKVPDPVPAAEPSKRPADATEKAKPKEQQLTGEELSLLSAGILQDVMDEVLRASVKRHALNVFISDQAVQVANEIMGEVFDQLTGELCRSVLDYEKKKHEKLKQLINLMSGQACVTLINEQLNEMVTGIARKAYLKELDAFIHTKSELFANSYFEETFEQLVFDICLETYQAECRERQRIIAYIREKRGWRLAGIYFRHWKRRCDHLKRYRFLRDNFPASCMENSPPALKRVLSVPELTYEPAGKRQLMELNGRPEFGGGSPNLARGAAARASLKLDLAKESSMQNELRQIQDGLRRKERQDDLSTKSKLEYARKALDNLKKVSKTFNDSLTFVRPFFSSKDTNQRK